MKKRSRFLGIFLSMILAAGMNPVYAQSPQVEEAVQPIQYAGSSTVVREETVEDVIYQALKAGEESFDVRRFQLDKDQFSAIYYNVIYNHGELYFVDTAYTYYLNNGYVGQVNPKYLMTETEREEADLLFNTETQKILSQVNPAWSDIEKAVFLQDYICTHFEYDLTYSIYDIYQFLKEKTGVCQAYAIFYNYVLSQVGIECANVTSDSMEHMWNVIKINDSWYHVDVTWDDPTADRPGRARHEYFLKSDAGISKAKHEGWVTDIVCDDTTFDDAFWNDVNVSFANIGEQWVYVNNETGAIMFCDLNKAQTGDALFTITDKWSAQGGGYWIGTFSGLGSYGGKIYYNTPDKIYALNPESGKSSVVFELPSSETKKLYGFYMDENIIYYTLANSPEETMEVSGSVTLKKESADDFFQDENIVVDNETNILSGVTEKTSVDNFTALSTYDVVIVKSDGASVKTGDEMIGTGDYVQIKEKGTVIAEYQVCISGDVDGDAKIDVLDMEKIQKDLLELDEITGVYLQAAMVADGEELSVLDMEMIQKHVLGIS